MTVGVDGFLIDAPNEKAALEAVRAVNGPRHLCFVFGTADLSEPYGNGSWRIPQHEAERIEVDFNAQPGTEA